MVPFAGDEAEAAATIDALLRLRLCRDDELIVVDNSVAGSAAGLDGRGGVGVVRAPFKGSSYYARNVGARAARASWLLFLDSDCVPAADLLDRYFERGVPDSWGAIAGGIVPAAGQESVVSRYARARRHLDQQLNAENRHRPMAVTANLLVRRAAFEQVGGFLEVRSGGDSDFSWRLQDAGWELSLCEEAVVEHRHREALRPLARQLARYAAGAAWLERRHPGATRRPKPVRGLLRVAAGVPWWLLRGDRDRALFKAIDGVAVLAETAGAWAGNAPRHHRPASDSASPRDDTPAAPLDIAVVVELFPELSQTFVASEARALQREGHRVRVVAAARGLRPEPSLGEGIEVSYLEDDGDAETVAALAWLAAGHPVAVLRDLLDRRRWRREEKVRPLRQLAPAARRLARDRPTHLHAHFAAEPGLDALRLSRLLGVPFSLTAHAYDIFQRPANLAEKLAAAAVVTTGCTYNVEHLRAAHGDILDGRLHEIVMGVDAEEFRRRTPYPGGRHVIAIGRLVEKKGFGDLIDAAALLRDRGDALDRLTIVGDGPLGDELSARIARAGLDDVVVLAGSLPPAAVRDLLETADVLAMPCVVAADGDRDSMPVVVKEALAMEIPVVATDEVGLPEVVRPEWGRLVPPHDPATLATALADVLDRSPHERRAMGTAGRRFVTTHCDVSTETRQLSRLFVQAS